MPYHADFNSFYGRSEFDIKPTGWEKLTIEFGYSYLGEILQYFWRVKGTQHTFRIPVQTINELSRGDYPGHVKQILENFRDEYLSWAAQGFYEDWMVEYHKEYRNFIHL